MFRRFIWTARPLRLVTKRLRRARVAALPLAALALACALALMPQAAAASHRSHRAKRSHRTHRSHPRRKPVLHARGQALEWSRASARNRYKLMVRVAGEKEVITVRGRSYVPAPVPGARVVYRVRAAESESHWSNAVAIAYPGGEEEQEKPHEKEEHEREHEREHEGPHEEGGAGAIKYRLDAATWFNRFALSRYAHWARAHVALLKAYPPFGDIYPSLFGVPVIAYHDPATEGQAPLGPAQIEAYVAKVRRDMSVGYAGVFIDDANWTSGFPPSPGPQSALADLIEAVRAAEPSALIEVNSQYHDIWPLIRAGNPNVMRALKDINLLCVEYGVGPTAGINTPGDYEEFMQYADQMNGRGIGLTLTGDRNSPGVETMEYNLATYFLINNGRDYINGEEQSPENWWSGWEVNLGNALAPREKLAGGLWTRRFSGGLVYTLAPQSPRQTIQLPGAMHSAEWGTVTSITLSGGQGAVLTG